MTMDNQLTPTSLICGHIESQNQDVVRVRLNHLNKCANAWQAQLDAKDKRIAELEKALAMTNCMIKSGEQHSPQSEHIIEKAFGR